MKNYFIANGAILNTRMDIEEMEEKVNHALDMDTAGLVRFGIKEVSEKEIRMCFYRDCLAHDPNDPIIYDNDMNLITGIGKAVFQREEAGGYPMIFPLNFDGSNFYTDITSFIRFYKFQLFEETEQIVEHIGLRCYSDRILMQIIF